MITTRRPELNAGDAISFAYIDGKFYFSNEHHAEIAHYLEDLGIDQSRLATGLWGTIYNQADSDIPDYVMEPQSDYADMEFQPSEEFMHKLDALFPDIRAVPAFSAYSKQASPWIPGNDQDILDRNRGEDLNGLPSTGVYIPGHGVLNFGSHRELQDLARDYMASTGIPYQPFRDYVTVDPNRATQIAQAYEDAYHTPEDPQVQVSYDALKKETLAQYNHLVNAGYRFEFYPKGNNPYPGGPREALLDLHNNKHMYVYPTYLGYGQGDDDGLGDYDHPLLEHSGVEWNDEPATYNDIFRAVHDVYGHAKEGVGFRANGEENAWRQHASMYSPIARPAMTAETRGQNSWVNFGPHGLHNQTADEANTIFAQQKATLLPDWVNKTSMWKKADAPKFKVGDYVNVIGGGRYSGQVVRVQWTSQGFVYEVSWPSGDTIEIEPLLESQLEFGNPPEEHARGIMEDFPYYDDEGESDTYNRYRNIMDNPEQPDRPSRFEPGDSVVEIAYGVPGSISSKYWNARRQTWQYMVQQYSNEYGHEGPMGEVLFDENDLALGGRGLDEPSSLTMKDFLDIPPEAEDYYRTANADALQHYPLAVQAYIEAIEQSEANIRYAIPAGEKAAYEELRSNYGLGDMWAWVWSRACTRVYEADGIDGLKVIAEKMPIPTEEFANEMWPDTLPWDEDEQEYYRTADYDDDEPGIGAIYKVEQDKKNWYYVVTDISDTVTLQRCDILGDLMIVRNGVADIPLKAWGSWLDHYNAQLIGWNPKHLPEADDQERIEEFAQDWPDFIPWGEDEQDYYRHSGWKKSDIMGGMDTSNGINLLSEQISSSPAATQATSALTAAGGQVYVVGGAVRDALMGKAPKDIDLMVQGLEPEQIKQALEAIGRVDYTGAAFGVFRFKTNGDEVEIALPRTERSTGSGHKDFEVTADPNLSPEADLGRRDFTINAMAFHPQTNQFIDPHGGMNDLQNGRLALVNEQAFHDDPLRIVRALVATARYGFAADPQLLQAMADQAPMIRHLPGERIQMEMDKILASPNPAAAFEMAEQTGVLDYLAPEVSSTVGFSQYNPHHDLDVWNHTLQVLRAASIISNDPDVRLAALFHDSGKPDSFWQDPDAPAGGGGHFYKKILDDGTELGADHEEVGGDLVSAFMNRLRYPNKRIEKVEFLVRNHMFPYFDSQKGARKFLRRCNGDVALAEDLLALRQADASGKTSGAMNEYDTKKVAQARALLLQVLEGDQAVSIKDLAINGNDLIQMGMRPGPEIGKVLDRLLEAVLENPNLNTREDLLQLAAENI